MSDYNNTAILTGSWSMGIKCNVLVIEVDDISHRVPLFDPPWDNDARTLVRR